MFTNKYKRIPCKDIIIPPDRQRREIDTSDIDDSIRKRGVYNPILITSGLVLIAGERRLTSSIKVGHADIACRFAEANLSQSEIQIIELEENVRRADLPWQDLVNAVGRLADFYRQENPSVTDTEIAEKLSYTQAHVSRLLRVHKDIADPKVIAMPTMSAAINFLTRKDERGIDAARSLILETGLSIGRKIFETQPEPSVPPTAGTLVIPPSLLAGLIPRPPATAATPSKILPASSSILHENFLEWAPKYSGPKFNFLHCDFPYGVDLFAGKKSGSETADHTYQDDETIYWELLKCLCDNRDNLLQVSCHIMFWFSMDYYSQTIAFFSRNAPEFTINPFPLIWFKSDGSGITPDPQRGPKRGYETALLLYRGDRKVVRSIDNFHASPTDKKYHPSAKPEPMLREFFQLFVDEHTRMLDPTCGGGSSIRAAESLGANLVMGLEKEAPFHEKAVEALHHFRVLAAATRKS